MNDLLDLASDRSHPYKKNRALANGDLPLAWGKVLAPLFIVAGLGLSLTISFPLMLLLTCYVSLATAYSLSWKQLPIVDVLCLTSFYTLRIYAGSIVSGLVVSKWLLMFSFFLFLSLALAKRVSDLVKNPGKVCGYGPEDSSTLSQMGTSAAYVSILVLAFYLASPEVTVLYRHPERLWGLCPLLFYWTSRLWLLLHRRTIHDDPVIFALQDRVTWTCGGIALVILGFAAS